MIYLISSLHCCLVGTENIEIKPNVQYCVEEINNTPLVVLDCDNQLPFCVNLHDVCYKKIKQNGIEVAEVNGNKYVFILGRNVGINKLLLIKVKNENVLISINAYLSISINGEELCNIPCGNIGYSHFEIDGSFCYIYFEGDRNFIAVLKDYKLIYANYYDEVNIKDKEKLFMTRLYDCMNHGKVFKVKDGVCEEYLIYLDDEDLNMTSEFAFIVFMDCLIAGNFKYCNHLLSEEMQLKNENSFKDFFAEPDWYYPVEQNSVVLFKKNALAGIYKFEVVNNKIVNIIHLDACQ